MSSKRPKSEIGTTLQIKSHASSTIKKRTFQKAIISRADWNFDKVPYDELLAALVWEYGREAKWIHNELMLPDPQGREGLLLLTPGVIFFLRRAVKYGFPHIGWQEISKRARADLIGWLWERDKSFRIGTGFRDLTEQMIEDERLGDYKIADFLAKTSRLYEWSRVFGAFQAALRPDEAEKCRQMEGGFDYRIFRINWNLSPNELGTLFGKWCADNRPKEFRDLVRKEKRGPGFTKLIYPPLVGLKYLGVRRRWQILPDGQRWEIFKRQWPNSYPLAGKIRTSDADNLSRVSRDRKRAEKLLRSLFKQLPLVSKNLHPRASSPMQ